MDGALFFEVIIFISLIYSVLDGTRGLMTRTHVFLNLK
ncbi:hypothetical protein RV08_GL000994 [Enterococcus mundtii]|nr:hypothetical protein RV08_GL000994 [Enterococcus mundtii]